jgi:multidrug efflux pump subunit AcrB
MNNRLNELRDKISTGFFGFWVKQYRVSYLIVLALVVLGSVAIMKIPKESSPSVKLGTLMVTTVYPWTNPEDMDSLVSDKIYKEIKDIKWIDKITSSSSLWVSIVSIALKTDANTKDVLSDVRNSVNKIQLPTDAKTPTITEIETNTNRTFSMFLYSKVPWMSKPLIFDRAITLQKAIEKTPGIDSVELTAGGGWQKVETSGGWDDSKYDVNIIIPDEKLANLGLTLWSIASTIQWYNRDQPIGNYAVGNKKYDFRIEGKNKESFDFMKTPITLPKGWTINLSEIATIQRKYKSDTKNILVLSNSWEVHEFVWLAINKTDGASIFDASNKWKAVIDELMKTPEFKDFGYKYWNDLADTISDDYTELLHEAVTTLILVFVAMYLFVGFKDSVFASVTLPLAFLATFLLLYYGGYTMNFLTNFSLILSFGIAVDTIIVIVQAASAKIRVGYDPRSAIMLALREYAVPIIAWVMTTIVVFIPMMTLPGILWKFLSFIPITIFWVLATGLVLALTVNSALYLLFVKKGKSYVDDSHALEYATDEEKELLVFEREGKQRIGETVAPLRIRVIHAVTWWYKDILRNFLEHTLLRRLSIFLPVVFLIFWFVVLAPVVGFDLFPSSDNNIINGTIEWPIWQRTEKTLEDLKDLPAIFKGHKELNYVSIAISGNRASFVMQFRKKKERDAEWLMDVFAFEKVINDALKIYESRGYKVVAESLKWGPPGSKAIGIKLIADNASQLPTLINVSKDFEAFLKKMPGTKNVSRSSSDTPGQFIFHLKKDLLAQYNISPAIIYSQISQNLNGITVWTVEDNGSDMDVKIKSSRFSDDVKMEDILSLPISIGTSNYLVQDFVDSTITNATATVARENGKIQITVESNLDTGLDTVSTQAKFTTFADTYNFPNGISYVKGWENESNSELIVAVLSAFFIAVIVIFAILTLQFNSFSQPLIVLYSVIMSLPFVMIWLILTGNKFSLPFGIGFIAFTGIAVNHGIILISAINENLKKWMEWITALVEAGSSRLEPMLLTTVTTALGILPIALRDKFWSWMGFTIIFGIIAASALTLFVVKGIYYEIYVSKHEWIITKIKRIWNERKQKRRREIKQ